MMWGGMLAGSPIGVQRSFKPEIALGCKTHFARWWSEKSGETSRFRPARIQTDTLVSSNHAAPGIGTLKVESQEPEKTALSGRRHPVDSPPLSGS
jgi:hypothetical protein